jgi:hypothetical protein
LLLLLEKIVDMVNSKFHDTLAVDLVGGIRVFRPSVFFSLVTFCVYRSITLAPLFSFDINDVVNCNVVKAFPKTCLVIFIHFI